MSELARVFPQIQALPPFVLVAFRCDLCAGPIFWYETAAQIVRRGVHAERHCPVCNAVGVTPLGYALPGAPETFLEER